MLKLSCAVQQYAWGKPGRESKVAALQRAQGMPTDDAAPYAEYWFGTHPNGPSTVAETGQLLSEFIKGSGDECVEEEGLPFLFKVLSIAKALSIQAHPDKHLAERLHEARPDVYKDDNHKPEMAIALTPFEALCGFRPLEEIVEHVREVPELRVLVGEEAAESFEEGALAALERGLGASVGRALLPKLFAAYARAAPDTVAAATAALVSRLEGAEAEDGLGALDAVVLRISRQFPGDVGTLAPYLLNYVTAEPGDALFLGANEPHAYLAGDIVECMACSDNVVRAGLTPKFRDVDTLVSMLTYRSGRPEVLRGSEVAPGVRVYRPPVPEFEVEALDLAAGASVTLPAHEASSSILLCVEGGGSAEAGSGEAVELTEGSVHFICSSAGPVAVAAGAAAPLRAFRVHTNAGRCE